MLIPKWLVWIFGLIIVPPATVAAAFGWAALVYRFMLCIGASDGVAALLAALCGAFTSIPVAVLLIMRFIEGSWPWEDS